MFGKLFAGLAAAGVLAAVLTTGAMAAPAGSPAATPQKQQHKAAKNVFSGTVTAVSEGQVTLKNSKGASETFIRTDATIVSKGLKQKSTWSEIEINSHLRVRFEQRSGKLYARRVHIGASRLNGTVTSIIGNLIVIRTRDGKEARITVSPATKYTDVTGKKQRTAGSLSAIHAGTRLAAAGSFDSSHNLDAAKVAYRGK